MMFINSNESRSPLSGRETARNQTIAGACALLASKVMCDAGYCSYSPEVSVIVMVLVTTMGNLIRNFKENSTIGRWIG